jgi:hypothetical protein
MLKGLSSICYRSNKKPSPPPEPPRQPDPPLQPPRGGDQPGTQPPNQPTTQPRNREYIPEDLYKEMMDDIDKWRR